jgi:hypothetical protein
VGIVAVLVWGAVSIVKQAADHRERLAMIERGIHPDRLEDEEISVDAPVELPIDRTRTKTR